jgi:hypothetical protein
MTLWSHGNGCGDTLKAQKMAGRRTSVSMAGVLSIRLSTLGTRKPTQVQIKIGHAWVFKVITASRQVVMIPGNFGWQEFATATGWAALAV